MAEGLEWPITAAMVREWTDTTDTGTDDSLAQAVLAVVSYVPTLDSLAEFWVGDGEDPEVFTFTPTADVCLGAVMLANRWHARRGTSLGTVGYAEFGTGTIMRYDPDIARLLRIGTSSPFIFGAPSAPVVEEEAV